MKATDVKPATTASQKSTPFFSKEKSPALAGPESDQAFFTKPVVQTKLAIGKPNDRYEQEADAMADKVVQRMAVPGAEGSPTVASSISPLVQTKCVECEKDLDKEEVNDHDEEIRRKPVSDDAFPPDDERVQRKCKHCEQEAMVQRKSEGVSGTGSQSIESSLAGSKNSGSPLPDKKREAMESSFGADFSDVRIHNDSNAAQMSKSLNAHAFAYGNDIYFDSGKYDPSSKEGDRLLAHELTHVVQQKGPGVQTKKKDSVQPREYEKTEGLQVQGAWYNFSIPFTDYEFDPSIEGIKTAGGLAANAVKDGATWVKDKAVEAVEWIYDKIAGLVQEGVEWLGEKFEEIKEFASSAFDRVRNGLGSVLGLITNPLSIITAAFRHMNVDVIRGAWNMLTSGINTAWSVVNNVISAVLSIGTGLWGKVSGFISGIFSTIGGLLNSRAFSLLPNFLQNGARNLFNRLNSVWISVRAFWDGVIERLNTFVRDLLASIDNFRKSVESFVIETVLKAVQTIREIADFVSLLTTDPEAVISPFIDKIANKASSEVPPTARKEGSRRMNDAYSQSGSKGSEAGVIQRAKAGEIERSTCSRDEVDTTLTRVIVEQVMGIKWKEMLWESFVNMFWPPATIKAIGHEFYEMWTKDWAAAVDSFFMPRNILDDFWGFFHDLWSNILVILDFPLALVRRLINVAMLLMGYVTIILILVGAGLGAFFGTAPGALAGALAGLELAGVIGQEMFILFLTVEAASAFKAFVDLFTARQTISEKENDYLQIAGSVIGIAVGIVLFVVFVVIGKMASSIVSFIKNGRAAIQPPAPNVEPPKVEPPKVEPPKPGEPVRPGEPPKTEPPKSEEPKLEPPKPVEPKPDPPKPEPPTPKPGEEPPKPKPGEEPPKPGEEPPKPGAEDGFRTRSETGHDILLAEDGTIIRCSHCAHLEKRFKFELNQEKNAALADELKTIKNMKNGPDKTKAAAKLEAKLAKVCETGEVSFKTWDDPNLSKSEMIDDYLARYPDTTLSKGELEVYFDEHYRLNHETGRLKNINSGKELVPDIKASEGPLDTMNTSSLNSKEAKALREAQANRDRLIKERDSHPKDSQEYKDLNQEVIGASEAMGERAADLYMKRKFNADPVYTGRGSRTLDKVYKTPDGKYYVVEAKGGSGDLGVKVGTDPSVRGKVLQQGTPEYLEQTLNEMRRTAVNNGDAKMLKLIDELQIANAKGDLTYMKVAQKVNASGQMKPIEATEFNLNE